MHVTIHKMFCSPVCAPICHVHLGHRVLFAELDAVCLRKLCFLQVDSVYLGWAGRLFKEKTACNMGSSNYEVAVVEDWDGTMFAPSSPSAAYEVETQIPVPYHCMQPTGKDALQTCDMFRNKTVRCITSLEAF